MKLRKNAIFEKVYQTMSYRARRWLRKSFIGHISIKNSIELRTQSRREIYCPAVAKAALRPLLGLTGYEIEKSMLFRKFSSNCMTELIQPPLDRIGSILFGAGVIATYWMRLGTDLLNLKFSSQEGLFRSFHGEFNFYILLPSS